MINASHVAHGHSHARQWAALVVAAVLAGGILATDLATRSSMGVSSLYVVPLLLAVLALPPQTGILCAWATTMLIAAGLLKSPWDLIPWTAWLDRTFSVVEVWTIALIARRFRETGVRLEQRTRDLADINYAIDQSAIVAVTNTKGTITFVNDRFCEISKYPREELIGQDHRLVNSGYHSKDFIRNLWVTIANGRIWRGEIRNRAKDGSIYWVDTTIVPFLDAHGRPYQYMAIRYEITARKRSEEQLREQAALARLGEMAAVVAHEVKNPIAGIRGALQVIQSRMPAGQRDKAIVGDIIGRLDALNAIVQDLLVFARPRQLQTEPVDVAAVIGDTAELLRRDPALSAVELRLHGSVPAIAADREQLRIAFQNVIINAAQAMSGQGAIDVSLAQHDGRVEVAIADHGPGMPAEVREKAFDPFFTTKHRGTGLGLPTAKRIVDAHGGAIRIEVPPAGGTIISIDLPIEAHS
ncbi:MAG: two-component system sensor histidine kinase NtrB [Betaproteobacteria bacterium]